MGLGTRVPTMCLLLIIHLFNSSYQAVGTVIRTLVYLQHNKCTHAYILVSSCASDELFSPLQNSFDLHILPGVGLYYPIIAHLR